MSFFPQSLKEGLSFELKESENKLHSLQADVHPGKLVVSVHRAHLSLIRVRRRALFAEAHKHKTQSKQLAETGEKLRAQLKSTKRDLQVANGWFTHRETYTTAVVGCSVWTISCTKKLRWSHSLLVVQARQRLSLL